MDTFLYIFSMIVTSSLFREGKLITVHGVDHAVSKPFLIGQDHRKIRSRFYLVLVIASVVRGVFVLTYYTV
jgi:hypothetical protein